MKKRAQSEIIRSGCLLVLLRHRGEPTDSAVAYRATLDDGDALWEAVCEHELEGVVAKQRRGRYVAGERGWVKVKNRNYWRSELEREGAIRKTRQRQLA